MTTLLTRIAPAAVAAVLAFAVPAAAEGVSGNAAPMRATVAIPAAGLDLSRAADRAAFDARIWTAIVDACGTASLVDLEGQNDVTACRAQAKADAVRQRDRMVARATIAGQPVLASK